MGINRVLGIFWGCSGGGNIEKIHRGIDPDENLNFQKIEFFKRSSQNLYKIIRIDAPMYFLDVATPGIPRKYTKIKIYLEIIFLEIFVKIAFWSILGLLWGLLPPKNTSGHRSWRNLQSFHKNSKKLLKTFYKTFKSLQTDEQVTKTHGFSFALTVF